MTKDKAYKPAAAVLVRPESGQPSEAPSTANLAQWTVSEQRMRKAVELFQRAGFAVSDIGLNSFTISGPVTLFEKFFGVKVKTNKGGFATWLHAGQEQVELPLEKLPEELRNILLGGSFYKPPDFGPTDFR